VIEEGFDCFGEVNNGGVLLLDGTLIWSVGNVRIQVK
jgi:hypothetical protein